MKRRQQVRYEFAESLKESNKKGQEDVHGVGDDWRFDHPVRIVRRGWELWKLSGYQRMPNYEEAAALSESWISDLILCDDIYRWVNPKKARPGEDGTPTV